MNLLIVGSSSEIASELEKALKKAFAPEFLNRIDDVVVFNSLDRNHINSIIDIELIGVIKRIKSIGYELTLTKKAKTFIADKGFDKDFGARPLKRAIQKYIEDKLAEEIVNARLSAGDHIKLDLSKNKEDLVVVKEPVRKE